jgi:drug/metabolite transporter (DMT)-like permease
MPAGSHFRGLLITLCAVLILSPDALIVKLMQTDSWTMLFWRSLISGGILFAGLASVYRMRLWHIFKQTGRHGLLSSMVTAIGSLLFVGALYRTTAANTLVILAATPLFAALIGRIFIQEKIAIHTTIAIIAVFSGILLIFAGNLSDQNLLGNLMALGASSLWGTNLVILRQARKLNMIPAVAMGSLLAIPLSLLLGADPTSIGQHDLVLLGLQGSLVLPISFALITIGSRYLPAAEVSLILLLETLLGPLWVWLLVGESPGSLALAAGLFVLVTLVLHSVFSLRRQSPPLS